MMVSGPKRFKTVYRIVLKYSLKKVTILDRPCQAGCRKEKETIKIQTCGLAELTQAKSLSD